jgi:hypothetical protein
MKNTLQTKLIVGGILALFFFMGVSSGLAQTATKKKTESLDYSVDFSAPVLKENKGWSDISIPETNGVMTTEGCPLLPVFSKTFEFPLGTQITSIDVIPSTTQIMTTSLQVRPVPTKQKIGDQITPAEGIMNEAVYASSDAYPASWYTITKGAGLNANNEHTLFVTVYISPVRYTPLTGSLQYNTHFSIHLSYTPTALALAPTESYQLVIITPSDYTSILQPLVDHKISYGVPTTMITLDQIYSTALGRDNPEQIKNFIKLAVEDWGTQYVLLVGDIKTLPIRVTFASWWEENILSDQYYADIYDAQGHFCSWDGNANNRFGETDNDGNDIDGVDLYADVHVGRLVCTDTTEVTTVVNKIITYETETYNQIWFKHIVLAGGDTFPSGQGAPTNVFEGEITNAKVGQAMLDFDQTYLWTSKHNLHATSFNRAINQGAGFVTYAGHGFEHGWATYRPNAITQARIWYFTPYVNALKNGNKLPIIFFDACLTAKLDFNFTDLQGYFKSTAHLLTRLFKLSENPSDFYPCFAWYLIQYAKGGAIATIGSTRTAYTWVDSTGVYGGAGYLDVHFFMAYHNGTHLGPMLTAAQNDYINNVGADYFTIEEFMLLGDPSLMVGGYQ